MKIISLLLKGKRIKIFGLLSGILFIYACTKNNKDTGQDQLTGMYKLYISENQDSSGAWHEDHWTKRGTGYIVYDGMGHMAVHITREGYQDFDWMDEEESLNTQRVNEKIDQLSVDELKAAVKEFSSSYVYIADYVIEDSADIVQHHRISSSMPAIWGTTVRRAFSFSGDTLILRILNGNRRLKWIKQP